MGQVTLTTGRTLPTFNSPISDFLSVYKKSYLILGVSALKTKKTTLLLLLYYLSLTRSAPLNYFFQKGEVVRSATYISWFLLMLGRR